jgi:serine/threonine-protein phosphatase 5
MGNKGAYIRFKGADMQPQIASFEKVDHPKVPPMAYANRFGSLF